MTNQSEQILELVSGFFKDKAAQKTWVSGVDWVQYGGPFFDEKEYVRAVQTLLKGWLVLGEDAITFEDQFPPLFGKKYGVLTNSGSSANLLMMAALRSKRLYSLPAGTKVIVPIAGFPTTFNPILQVGFQPVFVDIELDTLNLDLDQVEKAAQNGAKVITFAHVLANPPNMDKLMDIIKTHNLILLEDCCDALGSTYDDKPLGSFGEMASASFYPAHHITMGEGGFVATKTKEQEIVVRSLREWGRGCYCVGKKANLLKNGSCGKRFGNWVPSLPNHVFDHKFVYEEMGYNLKPIELQASIGVEQLKKLPEIHARRRSNYQKLSEAFSQYEQFFHLHRATPKSNPSWFGFPVTVRDEAPFKRNNITEFLESNKIQTRNYFAGNMMLQPAYSHLMDSDVAVKDFPIATKVTTDTFFLGTSPVITPQQIEYVVEKVHKCMKRF